MSGLAEPEPSSTSVNGAPAKELPAKERQPVVGIGASAGGLVALEGLIRRLKPCGLAYVVVQHLAPGHESLLADILARGTSLKVVTVVDGAVLAPDTVFVTPPGRDIALGDGVLHLRAQSTEVPRHSIDAFFRSLAVERGAGAIGVILSGSGNDGALGARAIRNEGGITFAQEPSTAQHASMPQSAIDLGEVDFVLGPAEIGDELGRLAEHRFVGRRRGRRTCSPQVLEQVFDRLRRAFGVDFYAYKLATIERRLERRMVLHKVERDDDYLKILDADPAEVKHLYGDLLIGVTSFFRDPETFEALRTRVFPKLFAARSSEVPIRLWVPGCASGEEAYSIAMCLLEYLDDRPSRYRVQIFGTDIDDRALARARQGVYPAGIEDEVSPARLQRFFTRHGEAYRVSQQLRDLVIFAHHNLGKDPPFSRLDLVSCRNVLIYLQPALQKKVLRVFHYALSPGGYLQLGASESVGDAADLFALDDRKLKRYARKSGQSVAVFDFFATAAAKALHTYGAASPTGEHRSMVTTQQLADRIVLEKFGPPGMLVDDKFDVIQFRGQAGPYLGPTAGAATLNVLKLVRPELLPELRRVLQKAASDGVDVCSAPVSLLGASSPLSVIVEALPLREPSGRDRCVLVMFREVPAAPASFVAPATPGESTAGALQVQVLEHELLVTKEYLQTSVRELEAANEELQTANEELQSINEELQSTNEELETSKEELQSTNEELSTINEELQNRMAQLATSNDDLQNLLADVSTPLVLVGADLRIRRFSAAAVGLLHLGPDDVGRPLGRLDAALNASAAEPVGADGSRSPQIEHVVTETIRALQESTRRVRASDGFWYTMRTIPYRTADHSIRGAVIELLRSPPARKIADTVEIHEMVGKVLSTLPHVLLVLDEHLRLVWVNKSFFDTFGVGAEVLGRALDDVWPARDAQPALWSAIEHAAADGRSFSDLVIQHPFGRASDQPMRFSARALPPEGDRPTLTLVLIEETR